MNRHLRLILSLSPLLPLGQGAGATHLPARNELRIRLAPVTTEGRVDGIDVVEELNISPIRAGARLISLPIVAESLPGVLNEPGSLVARDEAGTIPLTHVDDPVDPTGERQDRHWLAERDTIGMVIVSYLARPRAVTSETKPAALIDMRSEGAGVHGSARILLALPETGWPRRVRIAWDLSMMAPGSRAVTSLGEGATVMTLDRRALAEGYFMAGPLNKTPPAARRGFVTYYLTVPDFDLSRATTDVAATHRYVTHLFGGREEPFRVFMRTTDRFQGGGTGGRNSFMFGTVRGSPTSFDDLDNLLTLEMLHNWIGSLSVGPPGLWFVEGATNYYAAIAPYRAGRRTLDQVAAVIGEWTRNYYANPLRTMGDDAATAAFWTDPDAQILPYCWGALYIALVDFRLRAASGGRERVDKLVRRMIEAQRRGEASEHLWRSLVKSELGEQGVHDFEDMKAGRMLDLPEDLFGPCLRPVRGPVSRYMPGFGITVTAHGRHVVGTVRPGSRAEAAGLRPGDEVLNWREVAEAGSHPGALSTVRVRTPGGTRDITFDPWGPASDGLTWSPVRTPAGCGL